MKSTKKVAAAFLSIALAAGALAGCGNSTGNTGGSSSNNGSTGSSGNTTTDSTGGSANTDTNVISDVSATLRLSGPGLFTSVGETGSTDLVTGIRKPGYEVIVKRWNELYPNVKLEIDATPWDNWRAALQTAALSGQVDVLVHGASVTAIAEPVGPYLDKEPGLRDQLSMLPMRRTEEFGDFSKYIPYGLTISVNPVIAVVDKEILGNYGVEVPDSSWTFEDIAEIAAKTTGTDPVTGQQTYGIGMLDAGSANKNFIFTSRAYNAETFEFGPTLKETKGDFTKQEIRDVLSYLVNLQKYSSPDYIEGLDRGVAYKKENNLAIVISESAYDVYNQLTVGELDERFMFLPLPEILDGPHKGITSSHMGDWNMAIYKESPNKDLAWEFMKFMVTDEVVLQWMVETYSIPSNIKGLDMLQQAMSPAYYEAISKIVRTAPLEFSASTNTSYDSGNFGTFATDITSVLNEMFTGNMTMDQAIGFVQKNLDDYMKSVR